MALPVLSAAPAAPIDTIPAHESEGAAPAEPVAAPVVSEQQEVAIPERPVEDTTETDTTETDTTETDTTETDTTETDTTETDTTRTTMTADTVHAEASPPVPAVHAETSLEPTSADLALAANAVSFDVAVRLQDGDEVIAATHATFGEAHADAERLVQSADAGMAWVGVGACWIRVDAAVAIELRPRLVTRS